MVAAFINFLAFLDRLVSLVGFLFRLLLIAVFVAVASRVTGLFPPELLPYFWIAVGTGMVTVSLPAFQWGYTTRIEDQYQSDIEAARSRRDKARG